MLCRKCGTNNIEIARFCENCGSPLRRDEFKDEDKASEVPFSLIVAVVMVVLVVAGIFAAVMIFG